MKRIRSGGIFEEKVGYCRAVVADGWVHVAGTVAPGTDISTDIVDQCRAALAVIEDALSKAGASFADAVRVNYVVPNPAEFEACWPLLAETFGANPPAAMMISCALVDPKYKIEIELTAYRAALKVD
ncbi:Enamine deaminase RidA, house cleaning of reactive enamine intermediates, YjgF/YER057c/UK114 family [Yoonia tamlensis]|uniref:Enamine deaminase RidA, house cleaning of reactive enamine intermediates, YjgF/YER057c/UK114 family n=1 Tax=Yoonia tamlensis TaxID=390270 RepID=A0A1I6G232_9RHOB|nr:RidA family protein [Yoonia tamlensis]SFR36127.1 Enamine deaminase RidA, house cleaning of reactive enamine intermediates, YjgF/YER057c/UK114 family [Yoonia tamlensis]